MNRALPILLLMFLVNCGNQERIVEKKYAVRGTIVSRDNRGSTVTLDHERIEGFMEAMTMPFPVRDTDFDVLPPNGTRVEGTLHVQGYQVWLTDIREVAR